MKKNKILILWNTKIRFVTKENYYYLKDVIFLYLKYF